MNYSQNQKKLSTLLFHRKSCLNDLSKQIHQAGPQATTNLRNIYQERKKSYQRAQAQYHNLLNFSTLAHSEIQKASQQMAVAKGVVGGAEVRNESRLNAQIQQFSGIEPNFRERLGQQNGPVAENEIKLELASRCVNQNLKEEMKMPERRQQIPREIENERNHNQQQDEIIRSNIQSALSQHYQLLPHSLAGMIKPILKREGVNISQEAIFQLRDLYFKRNYFLAKEYKIREHKALKSKQNFVSKELLQGAPFSSHSQALEINGLSPTSSTQHN